ncbi:MAG: GNAT family N-acetyltransferase [Candidatus Eisenbacteria bacterium]|uniref:GNAT family N-acetyltransferase n=1 Tax=Eiseniibacteriota bacterium TaxID=2212470 RepID=A0A933SFP4_UNCEI|nr:GNAT family N-acetyltransferase [Candidatus Eisenbacteria bacterium]
MSAPVRVRPAVRADMPRIWQLLRGLAEYERWEEYVTGTPERLEALLFDEPARGEALVAERAQYGAAGGTELAIVGYALFYPTLSSFRTQTRLWLEDLFVDPAERGGGVGRALLASLARLALERGHTQIQWHVLDWNAPSIAFYERLGAVRWATDVYTYAFPEDALRALAAGND